MTDKLIVVGAIEAVPGMREELVATLTAHRARCLNSEKGMLSFEIMTAVDDDVNVFVHEVYQDAEAFKRHFNGILMKEWQKDAGNFIAKFALHKATPVG